MNLRSKQSRVTKILALHDAARQNYVKAEALFTQLLEASKVGEVIRTQQGQFELVDNFAESNTAFRVARISRFELKKLSKKKSEARDQKSEVRGQKRV